MTIPTQIQNQPLVSCSFLTFQINTRQSFAALQPRGESPPPSMSSSPLVAEGVFLSKARSFASYRCSHFCLVVLSRPGSHFHHAFCTQLLQSQQPRIQVTHAARRHVSWPLPVSRRVRFTHHFERQPVFHRSTANLQSKGVFRKCQSLEHDCVLERMLVASWRKASLSSLAPRLGHASSSRSPSLPSG